MILTSTAQAGQDRFAFEVLGQKTDGTFLDVGSYNNQLNNNSYALEQLGWFGLLMDIAVHDNPAPRKNQFVQADATKVDWQSLLEPIGLWPHVNYLSLDVDEATRDALVNLPLGKLHFDVLTIEHDAYVYGNERRDQMRKLLTGWGYTLVCADVMIEYPNPGDIVPFEDWYVSGLYLKTAERFRSERKLWNEILIQ